MTKPNFFFFRSILAVAVFLVLAVPAARAHRHIDAGVEVREVGARLVFVNGQNYATNTGFLYRLTPTNHVTLGPIFRDGTPSRNDPDLDNNPVPTSLPIEPDYGGPHENAALPGALLALRVVSVSGPEGGGFSLWGSDGDYIAEDITFTVPVGTTNGTHQFFLSQNDGSPGADPYGHIHGRRFSVDRPGLYTVGFQIVDISTNGPGGGPLHAPSEIFPMFFQAGTSIAGLALGGEGPALTFGTETGRTYHIEATQELGPEAAWEPVGEPVVGNGRLQTHPVPAEGEAHFFHLRVIQP